MGNEFDRKKNRKCKHCGLLFEDIKGSIYSNHVRWCDKNPSRNEFDRSYLSFRSNPEVRICEFCGCPFIVPSKGHRKKCCSRSCASNLSRSYAKDTFKSQEFSNKMSCIVKELWEDEDYVNKMLSSRHIYMSKGEQEIRKYFKTKYPDHKWTHGGLLRSNGLPIVRDMYSDVLKVCVEYDGIWHFENIKDQLKGKIEVDLEMERWCVINGYRLIRIDEDLFLEDKPRWTHILEEEILSGSDKIVKFWSNENESKRKQFISEHSF